MRIFFWNAKDIFAYEVIFQLLFIQAGLSERYHVFQQSSAFIFIYTFISVELLRAPTVLYYRSLGSFTGSLPYLRVH